MGVARSTISNTVKAYLRNNANELLRIKGIGPVVIIGHNQNNVDCVVTAYRIQSDGTVVFPAETSQTATAVTDEDTAYDGDTSEVNFSGEALNNTPIVPRTLRVKPTAGGSTVDATDRDGDGILYTEDDDEDVCGSIDYFTGDLILAYPVGKEPNTTNILADYKHEDIALQGFGRRDFTFRSLNTQDTLVIAGACAAVDGDSAPVESSLVQTEILVGGDVSSMSGL